MPKLVFIGLALFTSLLSYVFFLQEKKTYRYDFESYIAAPPAAVAEVLRQPALLPRWVRLPEYDRLDSVPAGLRPGEPIAVTLYRGATPTAARLSTQSGAEGGRTSFFFNISVENQPGRDLTVVVELERVNQITRVAYAIMQQAPLTERIFAYGQRTTLMRDLARRGFADLSGLVGQRTRP